MSTNLDRMVHATIIPVDGGRIEIVRYSRAGKWYYEAGTTRRQIRFSEAVFFAGDQRECVLWHEGRPGGTAFDRQVRASGKEPSR